MTTKFTIGIRGYSADVQPIQRDENSKLQFLMDALDDTFYMDEEEATASVEIRNVNQLKSVFDYYRGKQVRLEVISELKEGNTTATAALSETITGWTRTNMKESLSVSQGTEQIIAICRAMEK